MKVGTEWAEPEDPVDVCVGGGVSVSDLGGCVGGVRSRALEERETSCAQSACNMLVGHAVELPFGQCAAMLGSP